MACGFIPESVWNWKRGDKFVPMDAYKKMLQFNYFTCGTYYFDGMFNVVEFPPGMQLYHGSETLATTLSEFPLGIDYYKPYSYDPSAINIQVTPYITEQVASNNMSVEWNVANYFTISPGWFADPETARIYSAMKRDTTTKKMCKENCVFVYELMRPARFLLLDDNYNIVKLLNDDKIPASIRHDLSVMFGDVTLANVRASTTTYNKMHIVEKKRMSYFSIDSNFAKWLTADPTFSQVYAGYAANVQITPMDDSRFHLEFLFCKPLEYLRRNLSNPIDWQFNSYRYGGPPPIMRTYLTQLSYYKSTNVNFHAGNLLEHSVWSLLFAEHLALSRTYDVGGADEQIDNDTKREVVAISFIHDIGKMTIDNENVRVRAYDVIYNAIPTHPQIGAEYVRGTREMPMLSPDMKRMGSFNVRELLKALQIRDDSIGMCADVVALHWELGTFIQQIRSASDTEQIRAAADEFIRVCGNDEYGQPRTYLFFYTLIIVSIADVLASQPFGTNNLTSETNHWSSYFPYITNVPKKYRGGDIADLSAAVREQLSLAILRRSIELDRERRRVNLPMVKRRKVAL